MKKIITLALLVLSLTACKSAADRMYECEARGVSRDACYVAEHNRQDGINAQAQKQAMENAQGLYGVQREESTSHHKHHARGY